MLISACLIVKNEENRLASCLGSLSGVCDQLVVVDTGSTDRTVEIARAHGAEIHTFPWTGDFSAARNESLAHARGEFVLCIDADEEIHPDDAGELRRALASGHYDVIAVQLVSRIAGSANSSIGRYPRIFRRYADARFSYAIHEQIWPSLAPHEPRVLDSGFRFIHHGYDHDEAALRKKRERNLAACRRVLEQEPTNGFYLFQVGIGHLQLSEHDEALTFLERALEHSGSASETANIFAAIGQALFDRGASADAVEPLRRSADLMPNQRWAWALLGEAYLAEGRHRDAAAAIEQCLSITQSRLHTDVVPAAHTLYLKLGLAKLVCGQLAEAADALERSVQLGLPPALVEQAMAAAHRFLADRARLTPRR